MAEAASPSNHFVGYSPKRCETLLYLFFFCLPRYRIGPERVDGNCQEQGETGVEFVSVGVEGDSRGTVSDINDL